MNLRSTAGIPLLLLVLSAGLATILLGACSGHSEADPPADALALPVNNHHVLTFHNDNARTGQYLTETILTPSSVTASTFGRVAFLPVEGLVDAQPLFVAGLKVGGAAHNAVFVVTEHDLAYAFDADTQAILWKSSLVGPDEAPSDDINCGQITPEIGITDTPVIDLKAGPHGTVFMVAMSRKGSGAHKQYFQRMHALDLTTGAELAGSPQTIVAAVPGTAPGANDGLVRFDPMQYEDRAALLAVNGVVYTTWSSHCDHDPYNGWVIGYNESDLKQAAVLNLTPNGNEGALWMAGSGPAADAAGNIYVATGNGTFDTTLNANGFPERGNFGNALVKISAAGGKLTVTDYFTMHDTVSESNKDEDLGSGGIAVLPDLKDSAGKAHHLVVSAGKDTNIFVADRDSLGKFDLNTDKIYQELPAALKAGQFATPAYFRGAVYYGGVNEPLKAFPVMNAHLASVPASQSAAHYSYPGTTPSISANGDANAIVWTVESEGVAGENDNTRGILHAYDASDLTKELYNSKQMGMRDLFMNNKYIVPMIADGKVYVGTQTGVAVFGLLPKSK
jgi:hypothetical protein